MRKYYLLSLALFVGLSSIFAQVDLRIPGANILTDPVDQGGMLSVKYRVKDDQNLGNVTTSTVKVYLSSDQTLDGTDVEIGSEVIPGNSYNSNGITGILETAFTVPSDAPSGSVYVILIADANGEIAETDETNNEIAKPVTINAVAPPPPPTASGSNQWTGNDNTTDFISRDGVVGIGVTNYDNSGALLYVSGGIKAEAVTVELPGGSWGDFVFERDYKLLTVPALKAYIEAAGHLPNMPSEKELQAANGFDVAEMTKLQQVKIEELHLYIIQLHEQIEALKKEVSSLKK